MGKSSAPEPDPRIGQAALLSAKTGQDYLDFMKDQAAITNEWAADDRARWEDTYRPVEDEYIAEAMAYDSPERKAQAANEAITDVRQQSEIARQSNERNLSSMGVNPNSGRYAAEAERSATTEALASAGASNTAKKSVEATAEAMKGNVINMGNNMAVNPATSMGLSNSAAASGFNGAMTGYSNAATGLTQQYNAEMAAYNANNQMMASMGQGIGMAMGAFYSSKDAKTDKRKVAGFLEALQSMPVEKWRYKEGAGDGGEHVGPYAEDWKEKTGLGNGREIGIIDAIGVTMGAIKELAGKVDALAEPKGRAA